MTQERFNPDEHFADFILHYTCHWSKTWPMCKGVNGIDTAKLSGHAQN